MNLQLPRGIENELTVAKGKGQGLWECHVYTAIFKMANQQGPITYHIKFCSMLCASLDGMGVWGRMDKCIYVYVWLSPFTVHLKLPQYCIPIQNKKFKVWKKKFSLKCTPYMHKMHQYVEHLNSNS